MSYLSDLPEEVAQTADWALRLSDGNLLPVHGPLLYSISPVLAGLLGTKASSCSKYAVEVPCDTTLDVATGFLRWLYRQKIVLTPHYAKYFALLSHFWDIQVLKTKCEDFLVAEASKHDSFLRRSDVASFVSWLEVVDTCCLENLMPFCTAELIVRWQEIHTTQALKNVSARMLASALNTIMEIPSTQEILVCSYCQSPRVQLLGYEPPLKQHP